MRNYILSFLIIICLFTFTCEKEDDGFSDEMPPFPEEVLIDFDEDGIADFKTRHVEILSFGLIVGPRPGREFNANLEAIDSTAAVFRFGVESFLDRGVEISLSQSSWSERAGYAAVQQQNSDEGGKWPTQWMVNKVPAPESPYYFGLSVERNGVTTIGWIEFEFEARSGTMIVLDQNSTQGDSIVVGE